MADSTKSVGKLIYDRRTELGITQKEVADFVGVSEATVSRWESGHIDNMRRDRIAALSKILRMSPLAIMGIDDDLSSRLPNMVSVESRTFRIPVVGRVAAGQPILAQEEIIDYEYIDERLHKGGDQYFGLIVKGSSMEPTIHDGDTIIVRVQESVESGQIAVVLVDGEDATVKEVKETDTGLTLIGHNVAVYAPHFYSREEVEKLPVRIIGRVVQSISKF